MRKLKKNYFLLEVNNIQKTNAMTYKLLRKLGQTPTLEDTNLVLDVNSEEEAINMANEHIDILGDAVLDEGLKIMVRK